MAGMLQSYLDRQIEPAQDKEIGIGNFTALVRVSESYKLTADAPATPVEDGSFVNDHIILKPLVLHIEGEVSDVHLVASPIVRGFQRIQAEVGNVISQYAPARTQAQLSRASALANDAADAVRKIDNLLDTGEQILNLFGNNDADSKTVQEQFLDAMESLYYGKQAIAIDMPFRRHDNMVLTLVDISYNNEIGATSFTIEALQIKFAELQFVETTTPSAALEGQIDGLTDGGTQEGTKIVESFASSIGSAFGFSF